MENDQGTSAKVRTFEAAVIFGKNNQLQQLLPKPQLGVSMKSSKSERLAGGVRRYFATYRRLSSAANADPAKLAWIPLSGPSFLPSSELQ